MIVDKSAISFLVCHHNIMKLFLHLLLSRRLLKFVKRLKLTTLLSYTEIELNSTWICFNLTCWRIWGVWWLFESFIVMFRLSFNATWIGVIGLHQLSRSWWSLPQQFPNIWAYICVLINAVKHAVNNDCTLRVSKSFLHNLFTTFTATIHPKLMPWLCATWQITQRISRNRLENAFNTHIKELYPLYHLSSAIERDISYITSRFEQLTRDVIHFPQLSSYCVVFFTILTLKCLLMNSIQPFGFSMMLIKGRVKAFPFCNTLCKSTI